MPESKPKPKRKDTRDSKPRVQASRRKAMEMIDHLLDDVDIFPERRDGKLFITYDMGVDTAAALEKLANAQGLTLDQLMRRSLARSIEAGKKLADMKANYTGGQ